jgi:hypothetical protein
MEIIMTLDEIEKLPDSARINNKDLAKYLNLKSGTPSNWRSTGRYALPYIKIGRYVRYEMKAVRAWLADRTYKSTGCDK